MQSIQQQIQAARNSMTYEQRLCAKRVDVAQGEAGMFDADMIEAVNDAPKQARERRVLESKARDRRVRELISRGIDTPKDIAERTGRNANVIKAALRRLVDAGEIQSEKRGHYTCISKKRSKP